MFGSAGPYRGACLEHPFSKREATKGNPISTEGDNISDSVNNPGGFHAYGQITIQSEDAAAATSYGVTSNLKCSAGILLPG